MNLCVVCLCLVPFSGLNQVVALYQGVKDLDCIQNAFRTIQGFLKILELSAKNSSFGHHLQKTLRKTERQIWSRCLDLYYNICTTQRWPVSSGGRAWVAGVSLVNPHIVIISQGHRFDSCTGQLLSENL